MDVYTFLHKLIGLRNSLESGTKAVPDLACCNRKKIEPTICVQDSAHFRIESNMAGGFAESQWTV